MLCHFGANQAEVLRAYHLEGEALDRGVYQLIYAFFARRYIGLLHCDDIYYGFWNI
jgi:hypothetical protein